MPLEFFTLPEGPTPSAAEVHAAMAPQTPPGVELYGATVRPGDKIVLDLSQELTPTQRVLAQGIIANYPWSDAADYDAGRDEERATNVIANAHAQIDAIANLADARAFLKKLVRWLIRNTDFIE